MKAGFRAFAVTACLVLAVLPGAASSAAETAIERGAALQIVRGADIERISAKLDTLASDGEVAQLVAEARSIYSDPGMAVAARERLLYEAALALSRIAPTAEARHLIDELATAQPQTRVWMYDGPHRAAVPLYDVGAAARFTRKLWLRRAARAATFADLAAGSDRFLQQFTGNAAEDDRAPGRLGVLDAFASAPLAQLADMRGPVAASLHQGNPVAGLAAVMAERLGDKALFLDVVALGRAPVMLRMLPALAGSLGRADAFEVLVAATARPEVASAACFEIGALSDSVPAARRYLLDGLGDRAHGGSAAAALARLRDPATALELGALIRSSDDELIQRRAILALRLDGSESARAELRKSLESPAVPAALRQEVVNWARD